MTDAITIILSVPKVYHTSSILKGNSILFDLNEFYLEEKKGSYSCKEQKNITTSKTLSNIYDLEVSVINQLLQIY